MWLVAARPIPQAYAFHPCGNGSSLSEGIGLFHRRQRFASNPIPKPDTCAYTAGVSISSYHPAFEAGGNRVIAVPSNSTFHTFAYYRSRN